jgi:hypothetical protein
MGMHHNGHLPGLVQGVLNLRLVIQ